jgi:hypothetical protein
MNFGRLLLAGLVVTPLVSCGDTGLLLMASAAGQSTPSSADSLVLGFVLYGLVALVIVGFCIFLVGIPLALLLTRLRVPALLRDAVFVAIGGVAAWWIRANAAGEAYLVQFEIGFVIATVLVWIIAMHFISRAKRPVEQVNE